MNLEYTVVQASVNSSDSSGSGLDGAYGIVSGSSQVRLTKDYSGNNNSNRIAFTIIGYYWGSL